MPQCAPQSPLSLLFRLWPLRDATGRARRRPLQPLYIPALNDLPRVPEVKPVCLGFLIDDRCNVWVRDFPDTALGIVDMLRSAASLPPFETWTVLDTAGVWLGEIRLPERFAAHDIAHGRVYGVHTGESGAESVRAYRIDGVDAGAEGC